MIKADELIKLLHLEPLPQEGGFFVETYRSKDLVPKSALPPGYSGARSVCTAIYYLLTPETFSAIHRLHGDEIFHFYRGDPVEMLQLGPEGKAEIATLGPDLARGMKLQHVVAGGFGCFEFFKQPRLFSPVMESRRIGYLRDPHRSFHQHAGSGLGLGTLGAFLPASGGSEQLRRGNPIESHIRL